NQVTPTIGFIVGLKAFTAAVVGGIGSLPGAMLGGLLIGVAESMITGYISSTYTNLFVFALLIVVMLVRPSGLLGRAQLQKVWDLGPAIRRRRPPALGSGRTSGSPGRHTAGSTCRPGWATRNGSQSGSAGGPGCWPRAWPRPRCHCSAWAGSSCRSGSTRWLSRCSRWG